MNKIWAIWLTAFKKRFQVALGSATAACKWDKHWVPGPNYLVYHETLILDYMTFCWFWFPRWLPILPQPTLFFLMSWSHQPAIFSRCGQILPGAWLWKFGSHGLVRTSFLYLRKAWFWSCRRTYHSDIVVLRWVLRMKTCGSWGYTIGMEADGAPKGDSQVVAIATSSLIAVAAPPGTAGSLWRWLAVCRGA